MLTKILFTVLVIIVVALVFRQKNAPKAARIEPPKQTKDQTGIQTKTVIYALLGLIIAISTLLFVIHWQDQHRIINIRVTDTSGGITDYQAHKQSVQGRRFTTLDGREVTLGDNDRVEMTGTE